MQLKKDNIEFPNIKLTELKQKILDNEKVILDLYSDIQHILIHIFYFYIKNKDLIINAAKTYILRYCYNDYEKDDEILKNFDIKK